MADDPYEDEEDPGADIDRENQGEVATTVVAPTRVADLSSWRPAPGAQPFSPVTTPRTQSLASPAAVSNWRPAPGAQPFDAPFGGKPAESKPGIMGEVGRGLVRGGAALLYPIEEAANVVERKLGLPQAEADTAALAQREQQTAKDYAGTNLSDVNSVGSAGRYVAGKVGEIIPQAAGYMIAGVPRMVAEGALQGATEAAKQNNGDPTAAAVGAAVGAAAAGAPAHFLFGQAGQGVIKGAVRGALGMSAVNVGQQFAEPLAGVAAGNPYKAPTADQLSEALATGFLTGGIFGAVGGARTPSEKPVPGGAVETRLALPAPVAEDHEVALKDTLQLPAPAKQLPAPSTGYGEGFTMPPPGTPAVPLQPAVTGPRAQETGLLPAPDMTRGVSGEGFTVSEAAPAGEPAKPSGGMNRGNLIEQLTKLGENPQMLRRMKIGDLRTAYDQKMAQPEPTRQEFRPPVIPESEHPVDQEAAKAAGEPTPAQAEAGNYQKGHISVQGLDISIETPKGGVRRGPVDESGKPAWETTMPAHYGYIKGTVGGDGEHVDVTMGPRTKALFDGKPSEVAKEPVFIVDQIDPKTGKFDEHKALIGFHTEAEAVRAYDASFSDGSGPTRRGAVTEKTFEDFKGWLQQGDTTKPVAPKTLAEVPLTGGLQNTKATTIGEQLRAKRAQQKARMQPPGESPVAALVKKAEAKPKPPEVKIEEEPENVAEEVTSQPAVYEPGGPTTVVKTTGPKERSAQTTNLDRKLSDLEQRVVNGELSAREASDQYQPRSAKATHPDFASWIRKRIAEAPGLEKAALDKAAKLDKLPKGQRDAQMRVINKDLSRNSPDAIEKLKQALSEVEEPAETPEESAARQARKQSALEKIQAARKKLTRSMSSRVAVFYDERINRPVQSLLAASDKEGKPLPLAHYLDTIANDQLLRVRLPEVVALARRLRELAPPDAVVASQAVAARHPEIARLMPGDDIGTFFPRDITGTPTIALHVERPRAVLETVLHEALHSVTYRHLDDIPDNHPDIQGLAEIHAELSRLLEANRDMLTPSEIEDINYALTDQHELHTMLMSNPQLQRFAADVAPSIGFLRRMKELGFAVNQPPKTMWQAFTGWLRRALGLKVPSSFLDAIARPLQDITDRAAEYNRTTPEEQVLDIASHSLKARDIADEVIRHAPDAGNASRTARRALLQGATTDGIVNWNRRLFQEGDTNHLENYRTATENMAARSKEFRDKWADKVHDLINRLRGPERDKLAALMNDATLAEAHLGTNADNSHLTKPEQLKALADLQARYNSLSAEGKRTYNALRDYYSSTYKEERAAQLRAMIKTAIPEATPAQVEALESAARTMNGIRQLINNPDASPVASAFADAWQRNRALARGIARVHAQGFVRGDYFPLRRFGDWVVHYGTKGTDDYGVEMFDKFADADARRAELVKQGLEPSQVLDKRASHLRDMVPTTVMDELDAAVRHSLGQEQADSVRDLFASVLMQHASRSEAARTRLRRQGVRGASIEAERVLAKDFLALSSRLGYLEHGPERAQALAAMRRHADYLGRTGEAGEQPRAQAVVHELEQRMPSGDDASGALTGAARRFSTLGFVYSLMSPSHMLTSTIEAHMNSSALLGARYGYASASLALAKALKDISPTMAVTGAKNTLKAVGQGLKSADWNLSYAVRDKLIAQGANRTAMTDLFNRLNNAGLIDHSMVREMQRIAQPGGLYRSKVGDWWGRFMDLNAAGAHAVDVANKSAIAKAAYDLELRKTGSHDKAAKFAVEMARQAMPNYNLANKARISTDKGVLGGMAAPLTQFKQYGIHMYSMMSNLVRASINGASKQERREAAKAFAGILATHALMAGAIGGTFLGDVLRWVGGAYDWATGAAKPHDYQNDVRAWLASAFGPELGEIVARGLPHAAGFDIHRRVGLSNLLEPPELKSFDTKGFGEALAAAMTGAAGQDATTIAGATTKVLSGDIMGGLKDMVPRVIRDPVKAYNLAEKGVTDSKGKTILPPSKLSAGDIAYQALGFQPSKVSEFREGRNAILEAREEQTHARSQVMTAFTTAAPSDRHSVIEQVRAYNREHPNEPITYSQLLQAQKRQAEQTKQPGTFGLHVPKKSLQEMRQHGSFANSP